MKVMTRTGEFTFLVCVHVFSPDPPSDQLHKLIIGYLSIADNIVAIGTIYCAIDMLMRNHTAKYMEKSISAITGMDIHTTTSITRRAMNRDRFSCSNFSLHDCGEFSMGLHLSKIIHEVDDNQRNLVRPPIRNRDRLLGRLRSRVRIARKDWVPLFM